MVKELAEKTEDQIVIYSLEPNKQLILEKVSVFESLIQSRFGININPERFEIIHIRGRNLLTAKGFLTMVLHLLLPMLYATSCLMKYQPDIFYDTTGKLNAISRLCFNTSACETAAPWDNNSSVCSLSIYQ
jgi:hypothetical protein